VVLLPQGVRGRVKTIQVYKRPGNVVLAGQCTAMNIPQLEHSAIERGHVIAAPGYFEPQTWCVGTLRLLAHEGATIKSGLRLKLHTGTSELLAAAYPLEAAVVEAGQEALVQFRLDALVVAGPGDRFIVRSLSPVRTIGGGVLIDTMGQRLKRHRPQLAAELGERARAVGDDKAFAECCVRWAPAMAIGERELSVQVKLPAARVRTIAAELTREGKLLALGSAGWMHAETARTAGERLVEMVGEFHRQSPESPGMTLEELRTSCGFSKEVLEALVGQLKVQGRLVQRNQRLALPTHRETLAGPDQKLFEAIEALFRGRPFNPPEEEDLVAATGARCEDVRRVMKILMEHERLVRVPEEMYFHREAVEKAREILVGELKAAGRLESVRWKYLLNTTRKYALPLLDYFDRIGVTRRLNNTRYLKT
jgi:selenocysteine-specific elongation factor